MKLFGILCLAPRNCHTPCEHVFVFEIAPPPFSEQVASPWANVRVHSVVPHGWSAARVDVSLADLERIRREADAATAVLLAVVPGGRDAAAQLARTCGVSTREARRRRTVAAVGLLLPSALELLESGRVSAEHVASLAPVATNPGVEELLARAPELSPEDFAEEVESLRLSELSGGEAAARQRAARSLRFFNGPHGMVGLRGLLPPLEDVALKNRLGAILDAHWRAAHPERARTLGGHGGDNHDQRMADALLEITGTGVIVASWWSRCRPCRRPCCSRRPSFAATGSKR